jgi:hypothetical protein
MVALGTFAVAGIVAGKTVVGVLLLLIALAAGTGVIYMLKARPRLLITPRTVEVRGIELRWDEVSDVYISHQRGIWGLGTTRRLIFRRADTRRLLTVPLWLADVSWKEAVEQIERCGRPVKPWEDSDEERRLREAGGV